MLVPFFPYKDIFKSYRNLFHTSLDKIIDEGQYIFGDELLNFEESISKNIENKHCIGVANATDALEMMLSYHNFSADDEVILSSHTMVATLSAIIHANAKPVPVDIQTDGTICPKDIIKNINNNTKAIIVTQLNGHTCNMDEIKSICNDNNLVLFEDSAQALGSKFKGQSAGTFGFAGCLSFYPAKILGGPGDGGALITNDDNFYDWALANRDHGRSKNGLEHIGRNSRLDNLMASFLNIQLKDFEKFVLRRKDIAKIYNDGLKKIKEIRLPNLYNENDSLHFETFQNYELLVRDRDNLKAFLSEKKIGSIIQWGGMAIHDLKEYRKNSKSNFIVAKNYFDSCLMLPMNTAIVDEEINFVIDSINEFYA